MPTREEFEQAVIEAQKKWEKHVVEQEVEALLDLYDFASNDVPSAPPQVVFNPTLLDKILTTRDEAKEYFVGIPYPEQKNLPKLKKGFLDSQWSHVHFERSANRRARRTIVVEGTAVIAMGVYLFEKEQKLRPEDTVLTVTRLVVDYTFVYRFVGTELKIIAHHSSLPVSQEP